MAAVLAGEAAVRIVPTLRDFHSKVRQGLKTQPHSLEVKVNPNLKEADAEMAEWRARQRAEGVHLPVRADFKQLQRDLSQVEHIFKRSALSRAIRLNVKVIGLDALPELAHAAGSAASGLDALAKSAFTLPGILGGALAAAGALATGLHGVKDALKAYSTESTTAAQTARKQEDADRSLASAKRNLQNAIRDQRREMEDLNSEMRRSSLNEADAILSIEEDMQRLRKGGFSSIVDYQRAILQLYQDYDHLNEVRTQSTRTQEDFNQAQKQGIAGSDKVTDALNRLAEAQEKADASKVTKLGTALAQLAPNAAAVVQELHKLQGEWQRLVQTPTQNNLFQDLDKSLESLAHATLPALGSGLAGVAAGLNSSLREITASLGSQRNVSLLERLFGNTQGGFQNASRGMDSLIHAFLQLSSASANTLPRLGDGFDKAFSRFDAFTVRISNDGTLNKWMNQGLQAMDQLGNSFIKLGSVFSSISNAFNIATGTTGGFIGTMDRALGRISQHLNSFSGQNHLVEYFRDAGNFAHGIMQALKESGPFIHDVVSTTRQWSQLMLDTVGSFAKLAEWVERNTGLIKPLLVAYLSFRTLRPVIDALTGAWKAYGVVTAAVARQGGAGGVLQNSFNELKSKMAGLGQEAGAAGARVAGGGASLLGSLKNLAGYIGPGLIFTAAVTAAMTAVTKLGDAHQRAAQQADDQRAALEQLNQTLDQTSGAATNATLAQTSKNFGNYSIPNIGNVNVNSAAQGLGLNTQDLIRAASDPTAQGLRNTFHDRFVGLLTEQVDNNPGYQKFQQLYDQADISDRDIALAMMSDPAALAKYNAFMSKANAALRVGNANLFGTGLPADIERFFEGKHSRVPTLSDYLGASGDVGKVAFAYNNTAISTGSTAQANAQASTAAFGRYGLTDAGRADFGPFNPDPNAYGNGDRVQVRLNQKPPQDVLDKWSSQGIEIGDSPAGGGLLITLPAGSPDVQKFATGGMVKGVGGPTDDLNLAKVSPGEHIAQAKAVDYYGPKLFDDLNNMRIPRHWGGYQVPPVPPAPRLPAPPPSTLVGGGGSLTGEFPASVAMPQPAPYVPPPLHNPEPFTPAPHQGFDFGGAGTGGGGLTAHPDIRKAPPTSWFGRVGDWFSHALGLDGDRLPSGSFGETPGITITPNSPSTPKVPLVGHSLDTVGGAGDLAPIPVLSGLSTPLTPRSTPKLSLPPKSIPNVGQDRSPGPSSTGGQAAFNSYLTSRASLAPGDRQAFDNYWRSQGFNPDTGGTPPVTPAPPPVAASDPTQPSVPYSPQPAPTGAPSVPGLPIYSVGGVDPSGNPIVAPSGPVLGQMRGLVDSMLGTPYVWGGFSANGVDCSGLAAALANVASGRPAFSSRFSTANEAQELAARGFKVGRGGPGTLRIGWNGEHTAITLPDGTPVSSGETGGVQYGGGGADESQFTNWMYLPVDSSALDGLLPGMPGIPGLPALPGIGGLGTLGVGLPPFLQPQNIISFLGGQASNVGSGIASIGLQLLSGFTGINLAPLLGPGQQLANGILGAASSQGLLPGGIGGTGGLSSLLGGQGGSNSMLGSLLSGAGGSMGIGMATDPNVVKGQLPLDSGQPVGAGPGGPGGTGFSLTPGSGPNSGSGGAEQWRPLVRQIIQQVGPKYGITNTKAWEDAIIRQIATESSGNPSASNPSGASGILQFMPSTFAANNVLNGSYMDPASQIAAAIPYVIGKYGMNQDGSPKGIGQGHGFKSGGYPTGLAWLSKGEYRTNPTAVKYYGPQLFNALNSMSVPKGSVGKFAGGGFPIPMAPPAHPAPAPAPPAPVDGVSGAISAPPPELDGGAGSLAPAPILPPAVGDLLGAQSPEGAPTSGPSLGFSGLAPMDPPSVEGLLGPSAELPPSMRSPFIPPPMNVPQPNHPKEGQRRLISATGKVLGKVVGKGLKFSEIFGSTDLGNWILQEMGFTPSSVVDVAKAPFINRMPNSDKGFWTDSPGFAGGGFPGGIPGYATGDFIPDPPPAPIKPPVAEDDLPPPPDIPQPPTSPGAPSAPSGQSAGPLPTEQLQVAAPASTGGPPGPGATAPAPDPGDIPGVQNALTGIGIALPGYGGGTSNGLSQPGAQGGSGNNPRATLGGRPTSQEHNLPAISLGIQSTAGDIGNIAATALQIGASVAGAAAGGAAPMGAGAGGAAAGEAAAGLAGSIGAQGIQAGAQMAGQAISGIVNVLSSLMVGTLTPGSTASASGVPMLPQRQGMQTGVPAVNQRIHNGDINVTNLDQFRRQQEMMDAQNVMPYIGPYGA